ncbi:TspO/MBR family protein [Woodsholea maritima]|uniref:TspO/MBR family protein n=1 Tax=Woodsholea maritima TaxID=240237 RepID=UPI0003744CA8|nr:TspO/MBR family protein [Woodsholea maritima]
MSDFLIPTRAGPTRLALYSGLAVGIAGLINYWIFSTGAEQWAQTLKNPSWSPPGPFIGGVWMTLFALMGLALWMVDREGLNAHRKTARWMIMAQYGVNVAWVYFYFGLQSVSNGFYFTLLAIAVNIPTLWASARASRRAALILMPLTGWLIFALILSFSTWQLNISGYLQ